MNPQVLNIFERNEKIRTNMVKDVQRKLGFASNSAIGKAIMDGSIINLPITTEDIRKVSLSNEPVIPILKGKSTLQGNVYSKPIQLPMATPINQSLHIDIMYLEKDCFFISVSDPMDLTMVDYIGDSKITSVKSTKNIRNFVLGHISTYYSKGFNIIMVYCDAESSFKSLTQDLNNMGIQLIVGVSDEHHVPKVDRRIRTIKESVRCILHSLPYTLPHSLLKWAVMFAVSRFNLLRHSTVHQAHSFSPRELFTQIKTDFKRDLRVGFGDYCQTKNPYSNNSMEERTTSCIALLPLGSKTGSVKFFSLKSKSIIDRDKFVPCTITDTVIHMMNEIAFQQQNFIRIDQALLNVQPNLRQIEEREEIQPLIQPIDQPIQQPIQQPIEQSIQQTVQQPEEELVNMDDTLGGEQPDQIQEQNETNTSNEIFNQPQLEERLPATEWSTRLRRNRNGYKQFIRVNHIKTTEAIQMYGQDARDAILSELHQMHTMKVWEPVKTVPENQKIIPSFIFFKEKYDASGIYQKLKARIVAGGHLQRREDVQSKTSSPTISVNSVFIIAMLAAKKKWKRRVGDIAGAYLNAIMLDVIFMRLDAQVSEIICELDARYLQYLNEKGELIVQLKKALYGCIQSSYLWYECLKAALIQFGCKVSNIDHCIFVFKSEDGELLIGIYVDDLFITGSNDQVIDRFIEFLKLKFVNVTINIGDKLSYLGMLFDFSREEEVTISMRSYIEQLLRENKITSNASSPANPTIIDQQTIVQISHFQRNKLQSDVAKLLYLSIRVRQDIQFAVNHLCTRVNHYDESDVKKHKRILQYLHATIDHTLTLKIETLEPIQIKVYADASFAIHPDARSHSGVTISLGKGSLLSKSSKQRIVTKSSTEAELVAASDSIPIAYYFRDILQDLGYDTTIILLQDNVSTIQLIKNGSTSLRTKHINV